MTRKVRFSAILATFAILFAVSFTPGIAGTAPRSGGLSISIILPVNGSAVKGDVNISGNASGPGGVALSVQLCIDGGPWYAADGGNDWSWLWSTYAFQDGWHNVTARVQGGGGEATDTAAFLVRNTKPAFTLADIFPPGSDIHLRPGEVAGFFVRVETAYMGSYLVGWFLDGAAEPVQSGGAEWYNYTARAGEPGNHTVEVRVIAEDVVEASHNWTLNVRAWALPPVILGFGPEEANVTAYPGEKVRFNVSAADPQGKGLTYRWSVDGAPAPENVTNSSIEMSFNSTGARVVEVRVSNGETNRTVRWNVTVVEAPSLGLLDIMPCFLYIVLGLILGVWYGRREWRRAGQG